MFSIITIVNYIAQAFLADKPNMNESMVQPKDEEVEKKKTESKPEGTGKAERKPSLTLEKTGATPSNPGNEVSTKLEVEKQEEEIATENTD